MYIIFQIGHVLPCCVSLAKSERKLFLSKNLVINIVPVCVCMS